jgi:glycosyltransferase involved in cell wall biosynthesis
VQDIYAEAIARLVAPRLGPLGAPVVWHYRRLEAGLLRRSDQVVAITDDFRPLLESWRIEAQRISTIENWAPLEELPPHARDNEFSREHGLSDKLVFMYSGTLGLKHNPGLLLGIAERYRHDPRVRVMVISEGLGATWLAERKAAERLDNLVLLPFQPFARMPDMLASADVLMAILEPEAGVYSVPSKVLTYLCAGRPLLAAMPAENLAARIVAAQNAGFVVAPDDAPGFAAAAARLHDDPAIRTTLGCNARRYAEATFDIHRIGDRFEAVLMKASHPQ